MESWEVWLIVAGVLLIFEMLTMTFYLLWLGVGALIAMGVALIVPDGFVIQALSGGVAALLLTVFTKPLTRSFRQSRGYRDAIQDLVGKHGFVVEPIEPDRQGIVRIGNETWTAMSIESLMKDEKVEVISRGTTVLEVQKWGGSTE
jgi:inner membrane protein